ncbi:MAG: hypothetical protein Q8O62_13815 [Aequorivita sp.]|nr:hypothetical protein [Aequorivita sp.]
MKNQTKKQELISYHVVVTDSGSWLHAPGSDFLFAYLEKEWDAKTTQNVTKAFEAALKMSTIIKSAVKTTSGQDVVNGLYLLNQADMTKAMNSIDGMGETSADQQTKAGSGTAVSINMEFFAAVLGGLSGDVEPMLAYLTTQMGDVQAETKKSTVTENFGIVIGLVSVMPILNTPITSFQYVFSSSETSKWFVNTICGTVNHYSYDYTYTVVDYNYDPSS